MLSFHNSGWNPEHAKLKPGLVGMLHTVEQAFAGGVARLDYGPGDYSYKLRFGTGSEPVVRTTFLFPGPRLARAGAGPARNAGPPGALAGSRPLALRHVGGLGEPEAPLGELEHHGVAGIAASLDEPRRQQRRDDRDAGLHPRRTVEPGPAHQAQRQAPRVGRALLDSTTRFLAREPAPACLEQ